MSKKAKADIERMPPQDIEAEMAVLGAMLTSGKAIVTARAMLTAGDFYHLQHGIIFDAILDCYRAEGEADQIIVAAFLKSTDSLDMVGGVVCLAKLTAEVATAANIRYHARIVGEMSRLRWLIVRAGEITNQAYERQGSHDLSEALVRDLLTRDIDSKDSHSQHLAEISPQVDAVLDLARKQRRRWAGMDCGFYDINDATNGLCLHEFTIWGARPGVGKTKLMLQMVMSAVREDPSSWVLIFSLEMTAIQLYQYWACQIAGIDLQRFRRGKITDEEYLSYTKAREELNGWPVIIDDNGSTTVEKMFASTERHMATNKIRLVFVDYLQLMDGSGDDGNAKFDRISKGLKEYKKRYPVHLSVLSQLSRAVEARHDRRPYLADLRDSGAIEQNCDNAWLLYRPGAYEHLRIEAQNAGQGKLQEFLHHVEVIGAKIRFGPQVTVHLTWLPDRAMFANLAPDAPPEIGGYEQVRLC